MKIYTHPSRIATYKKALQVKNVIKDFLNKRSYLELNVPTLSPALIPEAYLEIFETTFRYMGTSQKLYLTPSPELFIKRLLVHGIGNCYYLGKSYRNSEPHSEKHFPEFTMLEFYKVGVDYFAIAEEVLSMLQAISMSLNGDSYTITYNDKTVSFERWEKLSVTEAFERYSGISKKELFNESAFIAKAKEKGYEVKNFSYEDVFSQIYTQEIENNLGMNGYPTMLYDYPKQFASLAKPNEDGLTAQRFEFYIEGIELGNCYSELTDWREQEKRFAQEQQERVKAGKIEYAVDDEFLDYLRKGLPVCAGIAIGLDRLAMIFTNVSSIEELTLLTIS